VRAGDVADGGDDGSEGGPEGEGHGEGVVEGGADGWALQNGGGNNGGAGKDQDEGADQLGDRRPEYVSAGIASVQTVRLVAPSLLRWPRPETRFEIRSAASESLPPIRELPRPEPPRPELPRPERLPPGIE